MNKVTVRINSKGYTLKEFLLLIDRKTDWYYLHSNGGKDYNFLIMAINGLEDIKQPFIDLRSKHEES